MLESIPLLAESLYHEALHKKLSNTIVVGDILRDGYDSKSSIRFWSYWNKDAAWNSNRWEFDRALYAYHVYVHLFAYYSLLSPAGSVEKLAHICELSAAFVGQRRAEAHERALALRRWLLHNSADSTTPQGVQLLHLLGDWIPPRSAAWPGRSSPPAAADRDPGPPGRAPPGSRRGAASSRAAGGREA